MTTRPLWTSEEIAEATGGRVTGVFEAGGVSIDTRTLRPGDLFVALSAARDPTGRRGVDGGDGVQIHLLIAVHEAVDQLAKGRTVLQQRGDVTKVDTRLGPVGNGANDGLDVVAVDTHGGSR